MQKYALTILSPIGQIILARFDVKNEDDFFTLQENILNTIETVFVENKTHYSEEYGSFHGDEHVITIVPRKLLAQSIIGLQKES